MNLPGAARRPIRSGGVIAYQSSGEFLRFLQRVLALFLDLGLIQRDRAEGEYLKQMLEALKAKHPLIDDMRGLGLMVGVELVEDLKKTLAREKRDQLISKAFARGLLLLAAGESSVRLALR